MNPKSLRRLSWPSLLLTLLILSYASYFSDLTLVRYAAFESRALDMGNLDQAVWNTAHGDWFHLTNEPGTVNRLSLHVEPILIPISWLYWLHSGPETLLVLQAIVVALGALPLFALARFMLKIEWLALIFALTFLLNPSLQAANWLEFHPLTLAPTFLMAAFFFLLVDRPGWFALFAVLAASCKEEMALLMFMMGLYAFFILRRRKLGLLTMLLTLSWALFAVLVIQNTFAEGNIHWSRYSYLGATPVQKVFTLLTKPAIVLAQLQAAHTWQYLFWLLLPVGFMALLAPEILLLALPSFAINLLADFPPMHEVNTLIYAVPIVPFVLMASVVGVRRVVSLYHLRRRASALHSHAERGNEQLPFVPYSLLLASALCGLVTCGAFFAQHQYGYLPDSGNYQAFTITDHHRRAASVIAQIPPNAKVSAQDRLNPHVSGRKSIYIFPRLDDADTIFLDVTGPAWPQHPSDLRKTVDTLLAQGFGVATADDGYLLLRKGVATQTIPDSFYNAWRVADSTATYPYQIDFADSLRLLDAKVATDSHGELVVKLIWRALKPIGQDVRFYVAYLDTEGNVLHDTLFYPPVAALWYPTSMWQTGATVAVQTLPWTLNSQRFTLAVGLYTEETGWQQGKRLGVTNMTPAWPLLENKTLVRLGGYALGKDKQWQAIPLMAAPPAKALALKFGDTIILDGVTALKNEAHAGEALPFTLYWRATQPPTLDYSVFAHLLDANGNKVAQLDGQPHNAFGRLPATNWLVNQPVVDTQTLTLPTTLTPGDYRLIAGLYNWQNGQRLPVSGASVEPGDVVTIVQLRVK
ncbi:MAG: DUF2079 domain-containing protein [Caldilineaceae bacterium]